MSRTHIPNAHTLVFLHNGRVALQDRRGDDLWKSDTVPQFAEDLSKFVSVDDSKDVLEWLVEQGIVTDTEADRLEIEEDSLEEDDDEDEDDSDDDLDDDADEDDNEE